jgi:WD40 repeat protein
MNSKEALLLVNELILSKTGRQLRDLQIKVFERVWEGDSYPKISEKLGYDYQSVKDAGYELWRQLSDVLGEKVAKNTVRMVLMRHASTLRESQSYLQTTLISFQDQFLQTALPQIELKSFSNLIQQDLGDAPDVFDFYGREEELATLKRWILKEQCRLVALLGMGGIGKTALSVILAQQIQNEFQYVIWQSLRESPTLEKVLDELIKFLSNQQEVDFSASISDKIRKVIHYLQAARCLLILDNIESVMMNSYETEQYLKGYEGYGSLFERFGSSRHQSCVILTSRVKPIQIARLEGKTRPIRSLVLYGLQAEAQSILDDNDLYGSESEALRVIEVYSGNPLVLKLASIRIQELFDGKISEFLAEGTPIFRGVAEMLDEQFNQLPDLEKSVMYWLATNREPTSLEDLWNDIIPQPSQQRLQDALEYLFRRSLIQRAAKGFVLQNVIIEYVTNCLIEKARQEIYDVQFDLLSSHALIKASARDNVRLAQAHLILQPIIMGLDDIENRLMDSLEYVRSQPSLKSSYAAGNILNMLCQLQINLEPYNFSDLTIRQAYLQGSTAQGLNLSNSSLSRFAFTQDFGITFSVAYSLDGRWLATGHSDGVISIWDTETGTEFLNCVGNVGRVYSVAFSPNSKILASGCDDMTVKLWDVSNGMCLRTMLGHTSGVGSVAFSPSGEILASSGEDMGIRIWNISNGACLKILTGHTNHVWSLAFNSTSEMLASGSFDASIKIWDVTTGSCLNTLLGHDAAVASIAFSPKGDVLASGSHDKTIRLWDFSNGVCIKMLPGHADRIWSIAFNATGDMMASGSYDKSVRLWSVDSGSCLNTLVGHRNWVRSVSFSPSGDLLASGSYDSTIKIWSIENGSCLQSLQGYHVSVCSVAISPSDEMIASGSDDQTIRLWRMDDSNYLNSLVGHSGWVYSVAFHPTERILASGSSDKTIRTWSLHSNNCINTFLGHDGWVYSVAFSPSGELLASGSADTTLRLWSVHSGACLTILEGHQRTVGSVTFNATGELLASGSQDETVRVWDVRSANCLKVLRGHTDQIWSIAFSPDGKTLASCSFDKTVRLWDVKTGKCLKVLSGHTNFLLSVAFSSDGKVLASGGYDQTVRLWDVMSGNCLSTLSGHTNWVRSVVFSSQKATVVSGSQDETMRLWDTETGDCFKTIKIPRPYDGMNISGTIGLTEAERSTLKLLGATE